MSGADIRVEGAATFRRTCHKAGRDLTQMADANNAAARLIGEAGRPRAPRRTGRLAASVRASGSKTEGRVQSTLVYAGVIHWGNAHHNIAAQPWLLRTATDTQPQWTDVYEHGVQRTLNTIRGT